ncbi:hypothetical protein [Streptomyces sp. B1I3]|uniref:hypothetical protein n=1 Tax=Streptomyces sp. B1I3 TaxID=3042264 RepID=UPI00278B2A98|nr:hypothetical protein [Streptomyces sp. B1I3]MDQ0796079.1 hypothetical protein [Streptomyces sp. B1I3]
MENWREGTRTGHTHEPHDVTIQLDGLGRQLSELPVEPSRPDPADGPVFVDESGRRSKTYRRLGWLLAGICAVYAVTLVVALLGGNSTAPWLPLNGQEQKKASDVEVRPVPTESASSELTGAEPGASASGVAVIPSASASASPPAAPGAHASASRSSAPPKADDASAEPAPETSAPESSSGIPTPSTGTGDPVEESPPASSDPVVPPVQPQEGPH